MAVIARTRVGFGVLSPAPLALRYTGAYRHRMAAPMTSGWPNPAPGQGGLAAVQTDAAFMTQAHSSMQQRLMQQQQHNGSVPAPQQQHTYYDMSTTESDSGSDSGPLRVPLKLVVQDAVKRWFNETLSEARRGDVKQQALLAQMLAEGYGCKQDLEESHRWAERARGRGYQMSGVYCEL